MTTQAPLTSLLFDLDGTLTDNFEGIRRSVDYALERLGRPSLNDQDARRWVGPPLRASFRNLAGIAEDDQVERAVELYRERYRDIGWRENRVYDGIADLLKTAADTGLQLFVCTYKPQVFADRILEHFELAPHFVAIAGTDLAGTYDDKAKVMAKLLSEHGLSPTRTMMIGDRRDDALAAASNGVQCWGVLWGYGTRDELEAAGVAASFASPAALAASLIK